MQSLGMLRDVPCPAVSELDLGSIALSHSEVKGVKGFRLQLFIPKKCENLFAILLPYPSPCNNKDLTKDGDSVFLLFLFISRTSKASSGMMMIQKEIMNQRNFYMEFR